MICVVLMAQSNDFPISTYMSPFCKIPFMASHISHCDDLPNPPILISPNFHQLATLQTRLEDVMFDSIDSTTAAVDIRNSEMAIRDL
jgi:hypothetical protein